MMWVRLKIDAGWADLAFGIGKCITRNNQEDAQRRLEAEWSQGERNALASLSLRSAFDLLLSALELPHSSEILFSAITIPDMPLIAAQHGLVPVAVPVLAPDCRIDAQALGSLITAQTRMIVVAQLFGNRTDLSEIQTIIGGQDILLIEDCAQAWFNPNWRGSPEADISLFSFGTIKTATAFGGGISYITDPDLFEAIQRIQATYPRQAVRSYLFKLLKGVVLKTLSARAIMNLLTRVAGIFRLDLDALLGSMTRGFADGDLLNQLRRQPSSPLLEVMKRRLTSYPISRISDRMRNAERIRFNLESCGELCPTPDSKHSDWLLPVLTTHPESLIQTLRKHGFDAAQRGRLQVIPLQTPSHENSLLQTSRLLDQMVFLPCYSEIPTKEVDRMCEVIRVWWYDLSAAESPDSECGSVLNNSYS